MNSNKLDEQALENIEVWHCIITSLDGNSNITLDREVIVEKGKTYPVDDVIKIGGSCRYDVDDDGTISFPTDSAHILATALHLMESENL